MAGMDFRTMETGARTDQRSSHPCATERRGEAVSVNYLKLAAEVQRETVTERMVRALDAHEIVAWIHRLEDEIEALEEPSP